MTLNWCFTRVLIDAIGFNRCFIISSFNLATLQQFFKKNQNRRYYHFKWGRIHALYIEHFFLYLLLKNTVQFFNISKHFIEHFECSCISQCFGRNIWRGWGREGWGREAEKHIGVRFMIRKTFLVLFFGGGGGGEV